MRLTELDAKFKQYHEDNPRVFELILKYAREAKAAGFKRYGMWGIVNRIRWHVHMEVKSDDFKISNDYAALYSRLLMVKHPAEFIGFFVIKPMKNSNLGPFFELKIAAYQKRMEAGGGTDEHTK